MKKFATLVVLLSIGLFTIGTIGCGGGDNSKPAKPAAGEPAPPAAGDAEGDAADSGEKPN